MDIETSVILNNEVKMPQLGLGTWQAEGNNVYEAVKFALQHGYRHIDTAKIYGNEKEVGRAIADSGVAREEIFVTTKLWNSDHDNPREAFNASLEKLGLDYVDLYLIHWPVPQRKKSWKVLESIYEEGKAKSIGVSNFTIKHLKELLEDVKVVPAVNQVEYSCFLNQEELLDFCKENKIQLEGYSPLARATRFEEEKLRSIADNHSKTPAQVMIRWQLQKGIVTIPKSVKTERIKQNADVFDFELSDEEIQTLDALDEGYRTVPDPNDMP